MDMITAESLHPSAQELSVRMSQPRVTRKDLKPGEIACDYCTAKCCRYFALPIDTPTTREDFDHIRWYMLHGNVGVFVEDETWYLMVLADCKHIREDYKCGIYETRPQICRTYTTDECEFEDDACYEKFFETPEQIWEYAEAVLPHKFPIPKPAESVSDITLPVLSSV